MSQDSHLHSMIDLVISSSVYCITRFNGLAVLVMVKSADGKGTDV
jgi:hypothetical protein